jgi:hypothetical protein
VQQRLVIACEIPPIALAFELLLRHDILTGIVLWLQDMEDRLDDIRVEGAYQLATPSWLMIGNHADWLKPMVIEIANSCEPLNASTVLAHWEAY